VRGKCVKCVKYEGVRGTTSGLREDVLREKVKCGGGEETFDFSSIRKRGCGVSDQLGKAEQKGHFR
jgi:hypothetical protein